MKKLITLFLILSVVAAQAQMSWSNESYATMQENCRILGKSTSAENVQKALNEALKNAYTYPANPVRDKEGSVLAKRLNIWKLKGKTGNYWNKWDYIVTVDVVWGETPPEIKHPEFSEKVLVTGNYTVPQDIKPSHKFYRPTLKEYKKLDKTAQTWVDNGGLLLKKMTASEIKKL